jgi:hypothetical protein
MANDRRTQPKPHLKLHRQRHLSRLSDLGRANWLCDSHSNRNRSHSLRYSQYLLWTVAAPHRSRAGRINPRRAARGHTGVIATIGFDWEGRTQFRQLWRPLPVRVEQTPEHLCVSGILIYGGVECPRRALRSIHRRARCVHHELPKRVRYRHAAQPSLVNGRGSEESATKLIRAPKLRCQS